QSSSSEGQKPVLVAPAPHTRTKLKTSSSPTARAVKRATVKSKRKQVKPRQDGVFKRFTLLVVEYIKEKFVWAKKKPVTPDFEHDKRIAENYVFDEVQGIYVPRAEYERQARFNREDYKPTEDEIKRFPSRPKNEQAKAGSSMDLKLFVPPEQMKQPRPPRLKPPGWN
ncbi:conjugal transfer protein, partial [Pectobacterium aquaticum]|nr:conjugal transfer protein [Pectobacterium aquaticum]